MLCSVYWMIVYLMLQMLFRYQSACASALTEYYSSPDCLLTFGSWFTDVISHHGDLNLLSTHGALEHKARHSHRVSHGLYFLCIRGPSRSPCGQPRCQGELCGSLGAKSYEAISTTVGIKSATGGMSAVTGHNKYIGCGNGGVSLSTL